MSLNIQTPNGLLEIGGKVTKEKIISALEYTPANETHVEDANIHVSAEDRKAWDNKSSFSGNYNDLIDAPNIMETDSGDMIIADESGNIIMQVNEAGLTTTKVTANNAIINGINIVSKLNSIGNNLNTHTSNDVIHISSTERESWNMAISTNTEDIAKLNSSVSSHIANRTNHITSGERAKWNNKSDFSGDYNDLINAPDIIEDNSGEISYADEEGNVIAKINKDGFKTTQVAADTVMIGDVNVGTTLSSHFGNTDIHITSEERETWNEKATVDYVDEKIANLVDSSPEELNTLNKLAGALNNNPNFAATISGQIDLKANASDLNNHTTNKNNPHEVTKSQIGLGNVDNTADIDKPVSTAQQEALNNLKAEISESIVSELDEWIITDDEENIIARIDKNGLETTTVTANSVIVNGIDVEAELKKPITDHSHSVEDITDLFTAAMVPEAEMEAAIDSIFGQ